MGQDARGSRQADSDQIRFVAGATRTVSPEVQAFGEAQKLTLVDSYEALLADTSIDAVVLATPHSLHAAQMIAAAKAGKHVFCEKPFALHKADAEAAVAATQKAGVTLGLGYNRRFHPEMTTLRQRIQSGELGTVLHFEATMTFPNALLLKPDAWRADKDETPCGGLTPMGVHAIDGMIDLGGAIEQVYCQSFRRVVPVDSDDTTSMLFRMKNGASGYLGHDDGDRARLQLPGVWLEGLGAARGHDARGRRLVRGAPHAPLQHRQVSADQGPGGGVGSRAPRRHARVPRGVCDGGLRRHAVSRFRRAR